MNDRYFMIKFKEWILAQEVVFNSAGNKDVQPSQTSNATAKVGATFMGDRDFADTQANLVRQTGNRSILTKGLMTAGAQAIDSSPANVARKTTAPMVAGYLQSNLGLPQVIKPPQPTQVKMMRKE